MADYIKSIIEIIKLAPRYLIAIGIAAAFLLFGREEFLTSIGLKKFTDDYRAWLGIAFISTISLFGVYGATEIISFFRRKIIKRRIRKHIINRLNRLTENEKQILRFYYFQNTRANTLGTDDGIVQGLVADGIIHLSASLGNQFEGFAHNITEIAWQYINENPHILEGTTNFYRTDKRGRL